jgi:DNA-directed RNA polymerase subunit RPC12/RpoP
MSIFDVFRLKLNISNQQPKQKDDRKAECPNCHKILSKIPGAKTKCPYCDDFMFVRTRPKDNIRVVVTKAEAEKIDEEWTIVAGTRDIFVAEKEEFEKEKEMLQKRFGGKEPSDNDVRWGLLNKQLLEHIKNGDWGLYRNAKFKMAEILRGEMRLKEALRTYFEVYYLDLNGPNNLGGITDPEILKEFPAFNPEDFGFLAPGISELIALLAKRLNLNKEELKKIFIENNSRVEKYLRLSISPEQAWLSLNKEIE